jgi:hypothetical protein
MAYDEGLAQRMRDALRGRADVTEKKMFGGIAFLLRGHMFAGVAGDAMMGRIGPEKYPAALKKRHVREMDFTGKPMKGYVFVDAEGIESDADLEFWLGECLQFASALPPKPPK